MCHIVLPMTATVMTSGASGTMRGVIRRVVVMVVTIVWRIPMIVVGPEGVTTPIGRVPAPIVPIAIAVTIVIWVVAVAVTVVVWVVPAAEHIGYVAGLHPHLIAHNHHGVECGVVGECEEVSVAIAVVPIGGGHTVGERRETLQTASVGTRIVVHIDCVVGDIYTTSAIGCHHRSCGAFHNIQVAQNIVNIGLGIGLCDHCCDAALGFGFGCCLLFGQQSLGLTQSLRIVHTIEVVGVGCHTASCQIYRERARGHSQAAHHEGRHNH